MAATTLRILSSRCLFTNLCRSSVVNQTLKPVHSKLARTETPPLLPETTKWRCSSSLAEVKVESKVAKQKQEVGQDDELYSVIDLEIKGHDKAVLQSYCMFISMALTNLKIKYGKRNIPKHIRRYTLLKSVHVHKKALVQYEMRTNYQSIILKNVTGSTANTVLEYIERNLPEGVAMKVTKHRLVGLTSHLQNPIAIIEKERNEEKLAKKARQKREKQEALQGQLNKAVPQTESDQSSGETVVSPVNTSGQEEAFASRHDCVPKFSADKTMKSDAEETKESNFKETESSSDLKLESDKTSDLSSDTSDSSSSDESSDEAEKPDK